MDGFTSSPSRSPLRNSQHRRRSVDTQDSKDSPLSSYRGGKARAKSRASASSIRFSKGWYFLYSAALAGLFPFLNVYYRRLGFSPEGIAAISTLRPWIRALCGPLFMWGADLTGHHRALFFATSISAIAVCLGMACTTSYAAQAALIMAYTVFPQQGGSLPDAAIIAGVKEGGYGRVRLWASIGWGVFSFLSGLVVQRFGIYSCFVIFAVGMALSTVAGIGIDFKVLRGRRGHQGAGREGPGQDPETARTRKEAHRGTSSSPPAGPASSFALPTSPTSPLRPLRPTTQAFSPLSLLSDWSVLKLVLLTCIWGGTLGVYDNFLFLYLDEIGTPPSLMGLGLTINTAIEVPVFLYSGRLLGWLGTTGAFHLVLAAYVARLAWYSCFMQATGLVWGSLIAEPLHGITFALAWSAVLNKIKETTPLHYIATVSAVISSLWFGLAYGVGALQGGRLYAAVGAAQAFRVTAWFVVLGWLVFFTCDTAFSGGTPRAWGEVSRRLRAASLGLGLSRRPHVPRHGHGSRNAQAYRAIHGLPLVLLPDGARPVFSAVASEIFHHHDHSGHGRGGRDDRRRLSDSSASGGGAGSDGSYLSDSDLDGAPEAIGTGFERGLASAGLQGGNYVGLFSPPGSPPPSGAGTGTAAAEGSNRGSGSRRSTPWRIGQLEAVPGNGTFLGMQMGQSGPGQG